MSVVSDQAQLNHNCCTASFRLAIIEPKYDLEVGGSSVSKLTRRRADPVPGLCSSVRCAFPDRIFVLEGRNAIHSDSAVIPYEAQVNGLSHSL